MERERVAGVHLIHLLHETECSMFCFSSSHIWFISGCFSDVGNVRLLQDHTLNRPNPGLPPLKRKRKKEQVSDCAGSALCQLGPSKLFFFVCVVLFSSLRLMCTVVVHSWNQDNNESTFVEHWHQSGTHSPEYAWTCNDLQCFNYQHWRTGDFSFNTVYHPRLCTLN